MGPGTRHRSIRSIAVVLAGAAPAFTVIALAALAPIALDAQPVADHASLAALPPLRVVDPTYIDRSANACVDFFQFANGAWLAHDTIPAAYSSSGVVRDMADRNALIVRSVLDDAVARHDSLPATSTQHKLGAFYGACMDSTAAERLGLEPIEARLTSISGLESRSGLIPEIAALQVDGLDVVFGYSPQPDPHDAGHYMVWLTQGGLGLPDRDYYTDRGPAADSIRDAFVAHVGRLLVLAGEDSHTAQRDAQRVMRLETALARASLTRVVLRVPAATDHPMSVSAFDTLAPAVRWATYAHDIGLTTHVRRLNVAQPVFFRRVDSLLRTVPMADWRAYLRYHVLATAAPWLSTPFVREHFAFTRLFTGAAELLPRWKRCERMTDAEMGEALGEAYVAKTFPPEAKARARAVIDDIKVTFRDRLQHLSWMSQATEQQALIKLDRVHEKVGYPDKWRDYSRLQLPNGPFIADVMAVDEFEWERVVNRPAAPVDTTEWDITVPTVNAYYDGSKNEMVFPAGALAPQTFDATADDAANYGSLGASWAGHELTHGFDDQGRHFDALGNLRDWWAPADSALFRVQADLIVRQFNQYVQVDTLHVNGQLTLGENIADYGGILTAFDALQHALARDGQPGLIDGFTPEQRFFLGYAQSFRSHTRPEALRTYVTVDAHAPDPWRVNGPLSNSAAFATAFGCKPGDPMVRPLDRVAHIW